MLRLRVQPAQGEPFERPLEGEEIIIGRSSECDVTIADRYMSRRHARLVHDDDRWLLEDLGSRNGTTVNGSRVEAPTPIAEGDEIVLSGSTVRIEGAGGARRGARTTEVPSDHTIFRQASELLESQVSIPPKSLDSVPQLRDYASRLQILNEVHQLLARSQTLDELLETLLERAFELLGPEEAVAVLRQPDGGYAQAARRSREGSGGEFPISETLVHEVAEKGMAALVLDVAQDERFAEAHSIIATGMRSLIAAPFNDEGGPLGLISLSAQLGTKQFDEADMEMLTSLAAVAALRMRNLALADEAEERRRLEREVALARQIQLGLLPEHLPDFDEYDLYGGTEPSQGVSGDFFEVLRQEDGRGVLVVIDVSGKGIGAALLTASLEALLSGALEADFPPAETCRRVSNRLMLRTPAAKYATGLIAMLEPEAGDLTYVNAGHNPGLLVHPDGEIDHLTSAGPPIGLLPSADYEERTVQIAPGDLLVLYTDGITEAANPDGDEFGTERLGAVCAGHRELPLEELAGEIEAALVEFAAGEPFADDRTLVLLRRKMAV